MKHNDYLHLAFTDIESPPPVDRREFFKRIAGGIVIFIVLGDLLSPQDPERRRGFRQQGSSDFNAFLRIGGDGVITCFTGKIEMGQGIVTSLPQMLADELDAPVDSIHMIMGDTDLCPWDMGTFGSMSTRFFGPALRQAGAEARIVLMDLAAKKLGVPEDQLQAKDGVIFDKNNPNSKVTYGELAQGKKIQRIVDRKAVLKSAAQFTEIGTPRISTDAIEKVTGRAKYAGDFRPPGMVYARILRPPAHGASLVSADTSAAAKMEGVQVVRDGDLVAVLHATPDGAGVALRKITAQWDVPEVAVNDRTIHDHLVSIAPAPSNLGSAGDLEAGKKNSSKSFESRYTTAYIAHAPMENHTAVAVVDNGKATVWASTQTPFSSRDAVADALGFSPGNVRVIAPYLGGGFGGKAQGGQEVEAARLAQLAGVPVQVEWTRAEEFFYDSFRPAAVVTLNSSTNDTGKITSWDYAVYFAGSRGARHFYDIADHRTVAHGGGFGAGNAHPFNTGAWRAPAGSTNTFARESQMDIMAAAAGIDPFEYRMTHLKDQRMRTVLQAAADKFGWQPAKAPSGRGVGIACGVDAGAYIALIAQVTVNKDNGKVQVERVVCAQDSGLVINPRGLIMQLEGCVTMGLGYTLSEQIRFEGGAVRDANFDTYKLPRFSWVPKIEAVLVDTGIEEAHGGGEPAIIGMGGAVANAIHDAVGVRLYDLPMTPQRVLAALA